MINLKFEISLRDLILYVLLIALFIFCFLKFQVYEMELGLIQRHGLITQSDQNIQVLNQNLQDHNKRITQLETMAKE